MRLPGKSRKQVVHLCGTSPTVQDNGSPAGRRTEGVFGAVGLHRLGNAALPNGCGCKHEWLVSSRKAVPRQGSAAVALHEYVNVALPNRSNRPAADNGHRLTIDTQSDRPPLHARFPRDSIELGTVPQRVSQAFDSSGPDVEVLIEQSSLKET